MRSMEGRKERRGERKARGEEGEMKECRKEYWKGREERRERGKRRRWEER